MPWRGAAGRVATHCAAGQGDGGEGGHQPLGVLALELADCQRAASLRLGRIGTASVVLRAGWTYRESNMFSK